MSAVVVFTPDVVGSRMAGPGVRAFHLAWELARHVPTTLLAKLDDFDAAVLGGRTPPEQLKAVNTRSAGWREHLREPALVISQPHREILQLRGAAKRVIWDLFDPVVLEMKEMTRAPIALRHRVHFEREWWRLRRALASGAARIHATPAQRHFYSGVFSALRGHAGDWGDSWLHVPFGVEEVVPARGGDEHRLETPSLIWGGGVWEWLDPATAIEAVRQANQGGVRCTLRFLGLSRPDDMSSNESLRKTRALIDSAPGLVVTNEWTPYRERSQWLLASRASIMLHRKSLESDYSIRTRFFDSLWCGVPVIASEGGYVAEIIRDEGLGVIVPPGDRGAVVAAIGRLFEDDEFHASCVKNMERVKPRFLWRRVCEPLVDKVRELQRI
ncbi:MAG TPA: glycosyltransferase [Thermoanaerobaculia bacterium]|nr:glycosyltransferase [Thermoanaerobaculia bacterium]